MKIETSRMILFPLTAEQLQYLVTDLHRFEESVACRYDGEPLEGEISRIFRGQIRPVQEAGENFAWVTFWMMVSKDAGTIMGSIDFKNSPDASGSVEIGYGINPKYQRRGYATEAVEAMTRWAFRHPDVCVVSAEVKRNNIASQRVLQKNSFQKYRTTGEYDWYHLCNKPGLRERRTSDIMFEPATVKKLFDLTHTLARPLLEPLCYPWEALPGIGDFILRLGAALPEGEYERRGENVWVAKSARVFDSAYLHGPCIIGPDTEVRQCAFVRGNALVGAGCVVGNSTELKNVILFDNVQVPHYNYVGDSILGYKSHMGAGSITSNVKSDKTLVTVNTGSEKIATGLKKMGAILGDHVEVGCNSVLNPGSVIGRNTNIYPLSMVRGFIPADSIYKKLGEIAEKR